jgi:hypothetical protein
MTEMTVMRLILTAHRKKKIGDEGNRLSPGLGLVDRSTHAVCVAMRQLVMPVPLSNCDLMGLSARTRSERVHLVAGAGLTPSERKNATPEAPVMIVVSVALIFPVVGSKVAAGAPFDKAVLSV